MSDITAALEDVRRSLDRAEASATADGTGSESIRSLLDNATSLLASVGTSEPGSTNGSSPPASAPAATSYETVRKNLDDVRRIAANLQNGRY